MRARIESSTPRGLVLAGGGSTRLGRPKAFVRLGGRTLLDRAIACLADVTGRWPWISAPHGWRDGPGLRGFARYPARVLCEDRAPGRGPAEGVAAALARGEDLLVLGVDMPLVTPDDLRLLLDGAARAASAVATYRDVWQPACCVVRTTARTHAEAAARDGRGLWWLLERAGARPVGYPRRAGPSPFRSVNTARDLDAVARALGRRAR